jgi:hypothetical protein
MNENTALFLVVNPSLIPLLLYVNDSSNVLLKKVAGLIGWRFARPYCHRAKQNHLVYLKPG